MPADIALKSCERKGNGMIPSGCRDVKPTQSVLALFYSDDRRGGNHFTRIDAHRGCVVGARVRSNVCYTMLYAVV